jgi:hypothetical protein
MIPSWTVRADFRVPRSFPHILGTLRSTANQYLTDRSKLPGGIIWKSFAATRMRTLLFCRGRSAEAPEMLNSKGFAVRRHW